MDLPASLQDFSLTRGGPFLDLRRWLHLVPSRRPNLLGRLLAFTLLGWLPLLVLTLPRGAPTLHSFLLDFHIHIQLLISLPVLIAAESYVDCRLALAARQLVAEELVAAEHLPALDAAAREAKRLRSLGLVDAGLLILSYSLSFVEELGEKHPAWLTGDGSPPTLAGWWYLAVSLPLFRFLVLWWLWRGTVWALFLFRVSRLPLALKPTHPDFTGGLRYLGTCQGSFSIVVFALACTTASATRQLSRGSPTEDPIAYAIPQLVLALVAVVFVFAPLLPFCGPLLRAKRRGEFHFSVLAARHSRDFEGRWFDSQAGAAQAPDAPGLPLLGAPDISSLADLGTAFDVTHRMRWFPWSRPPILAVFLAALAPLLPLLILDKEFLALLLQLAQKLL
jgi:hypothetical protein